MDTRAAYNIWAEQYDTNRNRTRDMEADVLRNTLAVIPFGSCLELGCGTGKNSVWLADRVTVLTAVDLSDQMLAKAKGKVRSPHVMFVQADITQDWHFVQCGYDLVTFSLVLEHIAHLDPVIKKAADSLAQGGYLFIGELHPFKQYAGTKARFDTPEGRQEVACYHHHLSDFYSAARAAGLELVALDEYFDENDRSGIPRILTLLFTKK